MDGEGLDGSAATRRGRRGGLRAVLGGEVVELGRLWEFLSGCDRGLGRLRGCFGRRLRMLKVAVLIWVKERERRLERLPVPIKTFLRCKHQPLEFGACECYVFSQVV